MANRTGERGWHRLPAPAFLLLALAAFMPGCSSTTGDEGAGGSNTQETAGETGEDQKKEQGSGKAGDKDKKDKETPVPVEVATVKRGDIESFIRSTANLEAEREVKIFSQASRQVVERRVEEGDEVKEGDLLLRLQDYEQRSALAKAQNEYDKVRREYEQQRSSTRRS